MNFPKIVSMDEYQSMALRTLNDQGVERNILHCAMGMSGEIGEVLESESNHDGEVLGEIGDCFWYAACLLSQLEIPISLAVARCTPPDVSPLTPTVGAIIHAARVIELIKKLTFYGKGYDASILAEHVGQYLLCLFSLCKSHSADPVSLAFANLNKLRVRYPERFTVEDALNRDYKAEAQAVADLPILWKF